MFGVVVKIFTIIAVIGGLAGPRIHASIISNNEILFQQQITRKFGRNMDLGSTPYGLNRVIRQAMSTKSVTHCFSMTSEAGNFVVQTIDADDILCGIYLFTDHDHVVEISFPQLDVPCEGPDRIRVVDGWILNGQNFPFPADHPVPLNERFTELCGQETDRIFLSSQNVALLQYRIPTVGKGFTMSVKFIKNNEPCNVIAVTDKHPITLRNNERQVNCTVTITFPTTINITALDVGSQSVKGTALSETETGTTRQCDTDEVQISGSPRSDITLSESIDTICGVDSNPSAYSKTIGCDVTSVRLVSTGNYNNSVTITARPAVPEEVQNLDYVCASITLK